ncbi:MAG: hydroxysqualene dehydroxylase HpnE [Chloroflexi bacterium]|nr:hydroxysqualene dehydroxylase HpnE [Chloroflexota bacterium]
MSDRDVIILGGGIAGIAAAVHLVKRGIKPTLIERRPFLGGRAFSFMDRISGEEIDNGQHVILGVCHQFLDLLEDLGTRDQLDLRPALNVPVSMNGKTSNLRANRVFGNAIALLNYRHLPLSDRMSIFRLLFKIKLKLIGENESQRMRTTSFGNWLSSRGQSSAAIERFWSLFILPVFNCHIDEVAALDGLEFTRSALLGNVRDAAIGYPKTGLSSLIGTPATEFLRSGGAELKTNTRVVSFARGDSGHFEVGLSNDETLRSSNVISALAPNSLNGVLPMSDATFNAVKNSLSALDYSPIVAVHLWYEKPVMLVPVEAFLDLGLQWVFNDTAIRGRLSDGPQHIVVSLSGADSWASLRKEEILDRVSSAMRRAFPAARENSVVNSAVVKTLEATIKVNPASLDHRLGPNVGIAGFHVAGDWTNTGLPATMEGAVKSGQTAADLALQRLSA